jgi:hypothetical protein
MANFTAVNPTAEGFVSVRPGDASGVPSTSTINFAPGQTVANVLTVQLPAAGNLQLYYGPTSGATVHIVVDVVGYFIAGSAGPQGATGATGPKGDTGVKGDPGVAGAKGDAGPAGSGVAAEFYALMGPDNAAAVIVGAPVQFPRDGPNTDVAAISRTSSATFKLAAIGVYRVTFQVPVSEPGQLVVTLNGVELQHTVVGRATGTSQITETALVRTTAVNSILTVGNPVGNPNALTITPSAGGSLAATATLIIELVK